MSPQDVLSNGADEDAANRESVCLMRHFHLYRREDPTGVSGSGHVAEGVVFSNGWVAMTWLSAQPSMSFYTSISQVEAIHGHGGATRVVFHDREGAAPRTPPILTESMPAAAE